MQLITDFRQRHVERFTQEIRKRKPAEFTTVQLMPAYEFFGVVLRSAIACGWYGEGITEAAVAEMPHREVKKEARLCWQKFEELTAVDPN